MQKVIAQLHKLLLEKTMFELNFCVVSLSIALGEHPYVNIQK